jgi:opacity protein-like surface antigen
VETDGELCFRTEGNPASHCPIQEGECSQECSSAPDCTSEAAISGVLICTPTGGSQITTQTISNPDTTTVSLTYGAELLDDWRVDFELSKGIKAEESSPRQEVALATTSYMVHGYYQLSSISTLGFSPFIGIGVGRKEISLTNTYYDKDRIEISSYKISDATVAYEAILGISYKLSSLVTTDVSYTYSSGRFSRTGKNDLQEEGHDISRSGSNKLESNQLKVNVRWGF